MAKTGQALALTLMEKNKSVKERADSYFESIKRNLQREIIDELVSKKDKLTDKLFELSLFSLETNLNAGIRTVTREECQDKLKELIETEYQLELVTLELKAKQDIFTKYFN